MASTPDDRVDGGVRSVQVALDVLEAVAFSDEELGVTQIAERLGLTKGSVHRHLLTLVERGYLVQNPVTSRYSRGPRSRLLAHYAPETDLIQIANGPMRELRDLLGHSVVLSEWTPRGALVLSMVVGTAAIEIGVRPGSELPFHSTAQGKVLLTLASPAQRERALAKPLPAFTAHTVTDRKVIEQELVRVAQQGFATAPEQAMLGINAVAVPIFDDKDVCIGALAVVGSIQFLPADIDAKSVKALKAAASQISRMLGHGRVNHSEMRAARQKTA
ncbi:MAG TPA: IclR family transcriptional regulator [Bradyrhizobium sp.]|uniref:IclR family transcriptional regulator n=1 Tax=Bradyrhizobium sp. TaxID=376 RepID=UPI002D80E3F8|nr:IclR family transcriptional regulator [Bradyrhizobium sp.]HET7887338.1 IclR family transcriptional regulator [Bradyrhizobium sp.]